MHPDWQDLVLVKTLARNKHDVEKGETEEEEFYINLLTLYAAYRIDIEERLGSGVAGGALTTDNWNNAYAELLLQVTVAQKTGKEQDAEMRGEKKKGGDGGKASGSGGKMGTELGHLYRNKEMMLFLTKTFVVEGAFRDSVLYNSSLISKKINGKIGGVSGSVGQS